eukprot:41390_1
MKFKIVWNNDTRIFHTDSTNWNEMLPGIRQFVEESYGIQDFNATYIDEENEKITISRSSDLREALNRYKTLKKIPKLHITIKPKQILESDSISIHGPRGGLVSEFQQEYRKRLENAEKAAQQQQSGKWLIEPAAPAMNTLNKIRAVVDQIDMSSIPEDKEFISIAIGDPTKFPNLLPSKTVTTAVQSKLLSQQCNGYPMSYGLQEARVAISKKK